MTKLRLAGQFWPYFWGDRVYRVCIGEQGAGRSFTTEMIANVIALATGGLKPDLTLIFDLPVAECLSRTSRRTEDDTNNKTDRLDAEDAAFHTRVRDAYLQLAANEPDRVRIINASGSINETHERVLEVVIPVLEKQNTEVRSQESE